LRGARKSRATMVWQTPALKRFSPCRSRHPISPATPGLSGVIYRFDIELSKYIN
jgi:hypothetical protein